ncbi:hypothetical protein GGQ74_000058 [Desulfobaculum xiamenense]|uniref:Uncharacterized protein n=1 Tax=Desulfobaculum xiamenense TaxID=995050 RepID=A0A846QDF7_9BACT|nr:hypothetical protein [Desulfobaculum xiamenense]NJB66418.1 hypothetical protein [Desulfobaculum xiamenense]
MNAIDTGISTASATTGAGSAHAMPEENRPRTATVTAEDLDALVAGNEGRCLRVRVRTLNIENRESVADFTVRGSEGLARLMVDLGGCGHRVTALVRLDAPVCPLIGPDGYARTPGHPDNPAEVAR